MQSKNIFTGFAILSIFGLIYFVVQPLLQQNEATQTVETVLKHWQKKDFLTNLDYWMPREKCPSVSGLDSYNFINKSFEKKDGRLFAKIAVELRFPDGEILPTGQTWIFEVLNSRYSWKITGFYPSN